MERITIDNQLYLIGYHTQELRRECPPLDFPIKCTMENAWLGCGYYFWTEVEFAKYWGEDFKKKKTGYYDIYSAQINIDKCINAVFSEKDYFFFRDCIEKASCHFQKNGHKVTVKQVHQFLLDKFWKQMGVTGILYDDLPINPRNNVDRKHSVVEYFENGILKYLYYKKRIQLVVFNEKTIRNFALYLEEQH